MGSPSVKLSFSLDGTWPDLPRNPSDLHVQEHALIAVRDKASSNGLPTVAVRLDLPDGKCAVWYTSVRLFVQTASLLAKRFPKVIEASADSIVACPAPLLSPEQFSSGGGLEVVKAGAEVLQIMQRISPDAGLMVIATALAKLHMTNPEKGSLGTCINTLSHLTADMVEKTKAFDEEFKKAGGA